MSFPDFPGIPKLLPGQVIAGGALVASVNLQYALSKIGPNWGVYKEGGQEPAIVADSFMGIEYANYQSVSNYPMEKGSFASYNKVQSPFSAIVTLSKGGSISDRNGFLSDLDALLASTDLLWLIVEDRIYKNVTIERYDYRRESGGGVGIIVASIHFTEIRESSILAVESAGKISSTSAPASALPSAGNGYVQSSSVLNSISGIQ